MLALILLTGALSPLTADDVCATRGTSILVDTRAHVLWLCERSKTLRELKVAIGGAGAGKTREGDGKVPLGEYALGAPQPSSSYTLFIPIGYPTEAQRKAGHTGSAIGVHGPPGGLENAGPLATSVDWTLGCIAVGTAQEIREIAKWVRANKVDRILIR